MRSLSKKGKLHGRKEENNSGIHKFMYDRTKEIVLRLTLTRIIRLLTLYSSQNYKAIMEIIKTSSIKVQLINYNILKKSLKKGKYFNETVYFDFEIPSFFILETKPVFLVLKYSLKKVV